MQKNNKDRSLKDSFSALIDLIPDPVIVVDGTEKIVAANKIVGKFSGYKGEQLIGMSFSELGFVSEEYKLFLAKNMENRLAGSNVAPYEIKITAKNGEVRCLEVKGNRIEYEGQLLDLAIFHDVTEREKHQKKLQQDLLESDVKFQAISNSAFDAIILIDAEDKIIYCNDAAERLYGYEKKEIIGEKVNEKLVPPHFRSSHAKFMLKFAKGQLDNVNKVSEFTGLRKNGTEFPTETSLSTVRLNDKKYLTATVRDITDRKALERKVNNYSKHLKSMVELRTAQLKDANERLVKSERLAAIGELAGMVGHDMRNPLTAIKNAAYYLEKKGIKCTPVEAENMFAVINKSIDHANKIINDLLDYSRETHLELTDCTPRTLLNETLQLVQVPSRIHIVNHLLDDPRIKADADKVMRVFINLIKNAIDAMPERGTIEITSHQTRNKIEITFADTGIGISKETLPKIFSPLFTTKAQGMGFGLAICKRIIESHGGTITVKTAQSKGTTFIITLPINEKKEANGENAWINMPESLMSTATKT